MPKVNPFISCGIGTLVSIILVVTGVAGNAVDVFKVIGALFGPICGAMAADYLLAGEVGRPACRVQSGGLDLVGCRFRGRSLWPCSEARRVA